MSTFIEMLIHTNERYCANLFSQVTYLLISKFRTLNSLKEPNKEFKLSNEFHSAMHTGANFFLVLRGLCGFNESPDHSYPSAECKTKSTIKLNAYILWRYNIIYFLR